MRQFRRAVVLVAVLLATGLAGCHRRPALAPPAAQAPLPQASSAALFAALKDHDTGALKALLARGVSPSVDDATGHGALNLAAQNGDLDAIKLLLAAGADINSVDRFGPAIWYAASFGQSAAVEYLLAHGANVDARNRMDQTSLIWCVRDGRVQMVELLLAHGADVNAVDRTGDSLLKIASLNNAQEIIPLLEKAGAHYTSPHEELMAAAAYGDAARIRQLLAAGASVDEADAALTSRGETALMAAAKKGQTAAVRTLLDAGASVTASDSGQRTALFYALESAHRSTIDALLAAGSDPTVRMGGGSTTLMQLATYMDDGELARRFIAAGVDPNATTDNGSIYTALLLAAAFDHAQVLQALLDAGASVNFRTTLEGETALIDAARSGSTECVRILLGAGADRSIRDHRPDSGKSAREWAVQFHHPEIVALLPAQ